MDQVSTELLLGLNQIAAAVAQYYQALLGNGFNDAQAFKLANDLQNIWFNNIFQQHTAKRDNPSTETPQ